MTTVRALVEETRGHLLGMHRADWHVLASDHTDSTTTISLDAEPKGLNRGAYLAIDSELIWVRSVDKASMTCTVVRGMLGTTPATHASGALVDANPRFAQAFIIKALRDEILSWGPTVFRTASIDYSILKNLRAVPLDDIPDGYYHILRVLRSPHVNADAWIPVGFRVERTVEAGPTLYLDAPADLGFDLRVTYAAPMDGTAFDLDTDLDDIGIPESARDIPAFGAAWRLLATREIPRSAEQTQGEPRLAAEIPPGYIIQTASQLRKIRDDRLGREGQRLAHLWGLRRP